jgi:hypothetical protein
LVNGALDIDSSTFVGNSVQNASFGGALAVSGGTVNIIDSTFTNNTTDIFSGGAIYGVNTNIPSHAAHSQAAALGKERRYT